MSDRRHPKGLIDTSVVIDVGLVDPAGLPSELAISAITLAELATGPHATADPNKRAWRQEMLQRAEAEFEALPLDGRVARTYGRVYAAVAAMGRKPRGRRTLDLLIAATALAHSLPLYTRNATDLRPLGDLLEVVPVAVP